MNSCEFVTFISAVACSLSNCCSKDELSLLAAVFSQLGDTLATILTREEICCKDNNQKDNDDSKCACESMDEKRQSEDSSCSQNEKSSDKK